MLAGNQRPDYTSEMNKFLKRQEMLCVKEHESYTWYIVRVTDILCQQPVSDLPGKDRRTLALVHGNTADDIGRRHPRFTAADRSRSDGAALVIATKYLTDAAV